MAGLISNIIGVIRSLFSRTFRPVRKHLCQGCGQWMVPGEMGIYGKGLGFHNIRCAQSFYERETP